MGVLSSKPFPLLRASVWRFDRAYQRMVWMTPWRMYVCPVLNDGVVYFFWSKTKRKHESCEIGAFRRNLFLRELTCVASIVRTNGCLYGLMKDVCVPFFGKTHMWQLWNSGGGCAYICTIYDAEGLHEAFPRVGIVFSSRSTAVPGTFFYLFHTWDR